MINKNSISGELPADFAQCTNLWTIHMGDNSFTALPEYLGTFVDLRDLRCERNYISKFPDNLYLINDMRMLICHDNQITGSLDPRWAEWTNLSYLQIWSNQLSGE